MPSMQDVIDFLLDLLRNEETRAQFEQDPEGTLAERGLQDITAQDVRDARLVVADQGGASAVGHDSPPGGNDPTAELRYTTSNYQANDYEVPDRGPDIIEQTTTIVSIDDRDTFIQNTTTIDNDITVIEDSFNDSSTTDVVAIQDNSTTIGSIESTTISVDDESTTDVTAINEVTITENPAPDPDAGTPGAGPAVPLPEPGSEIPNSSEIVVNPTPVPGVDESGTAGEPVPDEDEGADTDPTPDDAVV